MKFRYVAPPPHSPRVDKQGRIRLQVWKKVENGNPHNSPRPGMEPGISRVRSRSANNLPVTLGMMRAQTTFITGDEDNGKLLHFIMFFQQLRHYRMILNCACGMKQSQPILSYCPSIA
jgi:hypothetical protein